MNRKHITLYIGPSEDRALSHLSVGISRHAGLLAAVKLALADPGWGCQPAPRTEPLVGKMTVSLEESDVQALQARIGDSSLADAIRAVLMWVTGEAEVDAFDAEEAEGEDEPAPGRVSRRVAHELPVSDLEISAPAAAAPEPSSWQRGMLQSEAHCALGVLPDMLLLGIRVPEFRALFLTGCEEDRFELLVAFLESVRINETVEIWIGIDLRHRVFWPAIDIDALSADLFDCCAKAITRRRRFRACADVYAYRSGVVQLVVTGLAVR